MRPRPRSLESAQYSIPFCLGVAGWFGPSAFLPLEEHLLSDPRVIALSRKVSISVDPMLDQMFSAAVPARLHVTTLDGSYSHDVLAPLGEPSNPMSWEDIAEKLSTVIEGRLKGAQADRLREAIISLRDGDFGPLVSALKTPPPPSAEQDPPAPRTPSLAGATLLTSGTLQNV
jgi:2-methylcitrate dehydratase PrpD